MAFRSTLAIGALALVSVITRVILAQAPPAATPAENGVKWQSPVGAPPGGGQFQSAPSGPRTPIAKVSSGAGTLPNDAGQVWREYDITPYTLRVTTTTRPEQAIVDWILRETGYEAWHSDPVGLL